MRCPWCANPENLLSTPQNYIIDNLQRTYGKYYEPDKLIKECLKDYVFYKGIINDPELWSITSANQIEQLSGGVTFSGGESLLQAEALVPVCKALREKNIHIAVETCLIVPMSSLRLAIKMINFFYVDMKILNQDRCKEIEKRNLVQFLRNLDAVMQWKDENGNHKPVVIRIPVIGNYTDTLENRRAVKELLDQYKDHDLKIEPIKEHNLGENKYKFLNMQQDYHGVEDNLMEIYKDELSDLGILTEICKI